MISFELARELKKAGLERRASIGDYYYSPERDVTDIILWPDVDPLPELVWMPYLHQLLAEIEARGYGWDIFTGDDAYTVFVLRKCKILGYEVIAYDVTSSILEDAAAKALLWIIEKEQGVKK